MLLSRRAGFEVGQLYMDKTLVYKLVGFSDRGAKFQEVDVHKETLFERHVAFDDLEQCMRPYKGSLQSKLEGDTLVFEVPTHKHWVPEQARVMAWCELMELAKKP